MCLHEGCDVRERLAHRREEARGGAQGLALDVHRHLQRQRGRGRQDLQRRVPVVRPSAVRQGRADPRPPVEVRLRAPGQPRRAAVRGRLHQRDQPRPRGPAVGQRGSEPGPEGSPDSDQREQVIIRGALASVAVRSKTAPGPSKARRWFAGFKERETWVAYLFILPWLFGFLVLTLGPMLFSLYYSFTNYGLQQIAGLESTKTVGLKNYRQLLDDPKVASSLKNTFIYTVMMVPGKIIVAILLAMLLMRVTEKLAGAFRTIFRFPHITPPVAIGVMLLFLFNGTVGIVNKALGFIGIEGPYWTTDPSWIKPSIAIMDIWACGGTMVILLAALYGVPKHLYEAASMDGAGKWRRFRDVTLPMISPALFFVFIILTIAGLNQFTQAYTAYFGAGGSQPEAALFYSIYLFKNAFEFFNMGFASAMAWLLFAISMVITLINIGVSRRFVYYQGSQRGPLWARRTPRSRRPPRFGFRKRSRRSGVGCGCHRSAGSPSRS